MKKHLVLSVLNCFERFATPADTFTVFASGEPLVGVFDNVADGQRLAAVDGRGSFRVDYEPNSVVLSEFIPAPGPLLDEPQETEATPGKKWDPTVPPPGRDGDVQGAKRSTGDDRD